jgi:hypothetical protein
LDRCKAGCSGKCLDAPWRSNGDTVERLELLAQQIISGDIVTPSEWPAAQAVLGEIEERIRPSVTGSGRSETGRRPDGARRRVRQTGAFRCAVAWPAGCLPTGKNFYSVDVRAVPTETAWRLGQQSASLVAERYFQEEGEWPQALVLTCWGTANMRTGGDDIAQALALIGAKAGLGGWSGRVTGFEILKLSELGRPRIDVTLRVSGFFRDAFPASDGPLRQRCAGRRSTGRAGGCQSRCRAHETRRLPSWLLLACRQMRPSAGARVPGVRLEARRLWRGPSGADRRRASGVSAAICRRVPDLGRLCLWRRCVGDLARGELEGRLAIRRCGSAQSGQPRARPSRQR